MKTCNKCHKVKDISAFHKDKDKFDGHKYSCKTCVKSYQSQPRLMAIKRDAQRKYAKTEAGKAVEKVFSKKRWERSKAKGAHYAHGQVRHKLEKMPCSICGIKKAHAHHHDYSRPLDVIWLCPQHHADEHRRIRQCNTKNF